MDNDKLDAAVEKLRKAFHLTRLAGDVSVDANALGDVLDYIAAARRPALPDREAVAALIEPSEWRSPDRPNVFGRQHSLKKADDLLALFALSAAPKVTT